MPKIKQLPPHEAQKIAAGEVVERPVNIVKELVENSIDAGATRIAIYVEDGGKQLIRIVDNGYGMDSTDAQLCFDRHATSKITKVDELESINTFGFRGEALASIASISHITLITKEEDTLEGTQIIMQAHTITEINTVACTTGTDVAIHNIFFNVPARKKFLKATQTEWRTIQLLFNAFCFDYPHIHFSLFSEGKQVHNCPATDNLKSRALQLFEPVSHKHLINIIVNTEITITGVISDHQHYRYDRSGIYFFVNKRWVKNQHLSSAFIKGYANVIPHGRYPIGAISITIPHNEVDINIHPRKEEVKFLHPRKVEQALQQAVKAALENNLSQHIKKDVTFKTPDSTIHFNPHSKPFDFDPTSLKLRRAGPFFEEKSELAHFNTLNTNAKNELDKNTNPNCTHPELVEGSKRLILQQVQDEHKKINQFVSHGDLGVEKSTWELKDTNANVLPDRYPIEAGAEIKLQEVVSKNNNYNLIGQYNNTYLLVQKEDGLFLVDQHAAHERILYELFSQRFNEVATIQLLFPQIITLNTHDIHIITQHFDIFIQHGILVEQCASDQLIIQSLPVHLKNESITDLIKEVISWIIESQSLNADSFKNTIHHKLQAQMACKAAVKAGDILTEEKMNQLLSDLKKVANRFSCPHGRPTGWLLSLNEIERKFKRRL